MGSAEEASLRSTEVTRRTQSRRELGAVHVYTAQSDIQSAIGSVAR
jgi:hypothetical protein